MSDIEKTVGNGEEKPSEDRYQTGPSGNPVGCASPPKIIENAAELPSPRPFSDDCYTSLLHNPDHDLGSSSGKRSGKQAGDYYTNRLHNVRTHFAWQGGRIHYRRRVPASLRAIVGKQEIWRSLGTLIPHKGRILNL